MHPRNIYIKPPDFKQLAIDYPDFRKASKTTLSGKIVIDFKNPATLRILTKTLLLKDFKLLVDIPENTLIPTLPLRLNYILWIEDLLTVLGKKPTEIEGIDIGTGASVIYPLLASHKGWKMFATELDETNFESAVRNVENNYLSSQISVVKVQNACELLLNILPDNKDFDFCMCNPPFFSDEKDLDFKGKSRKSDRKEPSNAASGHSLEVITSGGELEFVKKLMTESLELKQKVKIYSTMVGQKSNFVILKEQLKKFKPHSVVSTEFHQGKTTRWGLAWTFCDLNLQGVTPKLPINTKNKQKNKLTKPISYTLPSELNSKSLEELIQFFKEILTNLKMVIDSEVAEDDKMGFYVESFENTWSNQRRKRREALHLNESKDDEVEPPESKKIKLDRPTVGESSSETLIKFLLILRKSEYEYLLEMSWEGGSLGKDGVHQILQYIKNKCSEKIKT